MAIQTIELEYGSREWLEYRKTHIGGSDAAAILGISPWKTQTALYDEKTALIPAKDISKKPSVARGKSSEELITALFSIEHPEFQVTLVKDVVYENDFMMASIDALLKELSTGDEGFLEVKTAELRKNADFEKWDDQIPDYYYSQIVHYFNTNDKWKFGIVIARMKEWFYNSQIEEFEFVIRERIYRFERSECARDMDILLRAETAFNKRVKDRNRPPLRLPDI